MPTPPPSVVARSERLDVSLQIRRLDGEPVAQCWFKYAMEFFWYRALQGRPWRRIPELQIGVQTRDSGWESKIIKITKNNTRNHIHLQEKTQTAIRLFGRYFNRQQQQHGWEGSDLHFVIRIEGNGQLEFMDDVCRVMADNATLRPCWDIKETKLTPTTVQVLLSLKPPEEI